MEYTAYFLCVALSALCGCGTAAGRLVRQGVPLKRAWLLLFALPLGLIGARGYYVLMQEILGGLGWNGRLLSDRPYEYAACGAVLGFLFFGMASPSLFGLGKGALLDGLAPGALAALSLSRLSEYLADFGWGSLILEEQWQFYPVAVLDGFGDWYWAVHVLEAVFALAVFIAVLKRKTPLPGSVFALSLTWFSLSQILCESLRAETLRWGFVRVQQVQCALFGAAVLLWAERKNHEAAGTCAARFAGYLLGVGALVGIEFILDRLDWPKAADYGLMAAVLAAMGALVRDAVLCAERKALPAVRAL